MAHKSCNHSRKVQQSIDLLRCMNGVLKSLSWSRNSMYISRVWFGRCRLTRRLKLDKKRDKSLNNGPLEFCPSHWNYQGYKILFFNSGDTEFLVYVKLSNSHFQFQRDFSTFVYLFRFYWLLSTWRFIVFWFVVWNKNLYTNENLLYLLSIYGHSKWLKTVRLFYVNQEFQKYEKEETLVVSSVEYMNIYMYAQCQSRYHHSVLSLR